MVVRIVRDEWGAPHIRGDSEAEAFFGAGYAQAQDRLDHVLLNYARACGRLAEVFGVAQLANDVQMRSWRFLEEAREGYRRLQADEPQLALNLEAFVNGIARFLTEHPDKQPVWARLEPALPVAALMATSWGLEHQVGWEAGGMADAARAGIVPPPVDTLVGTPMASNAWALAPWRTADGVAVAMADPHNQLQGSATELHLQGGGFHACGFAFPGAPLPYVGHNEHIGWGTTVGGPDVADCYIIETDPADPTRYRFDDGWRRVETRSITIAVKDAAAVTLDVEYVVLNGLTVPVIRRDGNRLYAAVGSLDNYAEGPTRHIYAMLKARDVHAWMSALEPPGMFPVNLVGADTSGNVFYIRTGRVPIRPAGFDWSRPVDGNTSASEWRGLHAASDLVHWINPPSGYLLSANNAPDVMAPGCPLTPQAYPRYIFNAEAGRNTSRGVLGVELLSRAFAVDLPRLLELTYDERWLGVAPWQGALAAAVGEDPEWAKARGPFERRLLGRVLTFDGEARKESREALAYFHWQQAIAAEAQARGLDIASLNRKGLAGQILTRGESQAVMAAIVRAAADMAALYGEGDPQLGDIFRAGRGDVSVPVGGCTRLVAPGREGESWNAITMPPSTFRAGHVGAPDDQGRVKMHSGQSHPHLMIMSRPPISYSAHPFGQSDDPASAHYSDQTRLYSEKRLKPTYFDWRGLEERIDSATVLEWRPAAAPLATATAGAAP